MPTRRPVALVQEGRELMDRPNEIIIKLGACGFWVIIIFLLGVVGSVLVAILVGIPACVIMTMMLLAVDDEKRRAQ